MNTTTSSHKSKGQTGITVVTALGATFALFLPWNSWLSVRSVDQGETLSAITQWQTDTTAKIDYLIKISNQNHAAIVGDYSTTSADETVYAQL